MDFRINMSNDSETIYERLKSPGRYTLGKCRLDQAPLRRVELYAESFRVSGESYIGYELKANIFAHASPHQLTIPAYLTTYYTLKSVSGISYISGKKYVFALINNPLGFVIKTSIFRISAQRLTTIELFDEYLRNFLSVIHLTVNGIYEETMNSSKLETRLDVSCERIAESQERAFLESATPLGEPWLKTDLGVKTAHPVGISLERPKVSFDSIGGQTEAKAELKDLGFALTNPEIYTAWGTRPAKGILLNGPPGNGKTLLAKALAAETNASFFSINIADVVSKWYGASEQNIQGIFNQARKNQPAIILWDEIDALAGSRDDAHEVTRRIVSTILTNMDGFQSADRIINIATTNRLDAVDSAIKRPGRFDRIIEVPLPNLGGRIEILTIRMTAAEQIAQRIIFHEIDRETIAMAMQRMSGADITEIVRRTLEGKVRQAINGQKPTLVTNQDILYRVKTYEHVDQKRKSIGFID